jgi:LuxR family maltose regulon positive regulatory protein
MKPEAVDYYQTAIELFKLIQVEYRRAQKELQEMSLHLAQRENVAVDKLNSALGSLNRSNTISESATQLSVLTLEAYCLGKFQVRVNSKKIEQWRSTKAKCILKLLIADGMHPVPKDILIESIWPGCEPLQGNNNLKAAVRALRQTLNHDNGINEGPPIILFEDGNYMVNPNVDMWVDAEQFEHHCKAGRRFEVDGKLVEAIREHKAAVTLYRGDYLEDDPYEEWTYLRREALKDEYLSVLGKLAEYSMRAKNYEDCISYCQKILSKDYCREDTYGRLMCCYNRLGQRGRAIEWYRLCEKIIRRELDVGPNQELVALFQKLIRGEYI